jgi:hypothetical protein
MGEDEQRAKLRLVETAPAITGETRSDRAPQPAAASARSHDTRRVRPAPQPAAASAMP